MKVRIETAEDLQEDEIVIKCKKITQSIKKLSETILSGNLAAPKITFYKKSEEHYLPLQEILFFETSKENVCAHTAADTFKVKFRLYELEDILPHFFVRVSKSTIINITGVLSIDKNLASASLVRFQKSYKQVYASRFYYKNLKQRLNERSHYED